MNFFRLTLLPYVQGYFNIASIFDIDRLYYQDLTAEFTKSKLELALYLTFSGDADVCPGLGWNHDAVDIKVSMDSHFDECSKVLINDIGSWEGVFKGKDAKWFETCVDSDDVTADFTTWNFYDKVQDTIVYGTREPDSVMHCFKIPILSSTAASNPIDMMSKIAFSRVGNYLGMNHTKSVSRLYNLVGQA